LKTLRKLENWEQICFDEVDDDVHGQISGVWLTAAWHLLKYTSQVKNEKCVF